MTNFTERELIVLNKLVNQELDIRSYLSEEYSELSAIKDKLQKLHDEQSRIKSFAKATIATRIDNTIHDIVKAEFTNAYSLRKLSVQTLIEAYNNHGQHQIDFTKIYDLDE